MLYPIYYRGDGFSGKLIVVVGMQFGSEGKGAITSHLAPTIDMGVRSGSANAGHTIYFQNKKFVMRQIPTAWINPKAKLVIGAGALVSSDVLLKEIEYISRFSKIKHRLFIDYRAHVITPEQIRQEQQTDLGTRIGSTSALSCEGIGAAAADKVLRKSSCLRAKDFPELKPYLTDTVDLINTSLDDGGRVILEGTQGLGLSLDYGYFPFVTSRDTTAGSLAASVGVSIHQFDAEIIGVVRTYPIRVAGNSGPFGKDAQEISWEDVARNAGTSRKIKEKTSVTHKVRRVSTFSKSEFVKACRINRPTCLALTFADYLDWSVHERKEISDPVKSFIEMIEDLSEISVCLIKTGPKAIIDLEREKVNQFYKSLADRWRQNLAAS